jgi:hypothetical protein
MSDNRYKELMISALIGIDLNTQEEDPIFVLDHMKFVDWMIQNNLELDEAMDILDEHGSHMLIYKVEKPKKQKIKDYPIGDE